MATLSLKISLEGGKVVKTIQFSPSTTVYDACKIIREKILEASSSDPKEYGLFLASEEDNKKGIWLEASRSLDYYMLRKGDLLEYNKKTRNLRVRMLDGTVKTLLVDDSQIVANLMVVICTKIGITNYDEYGLVREDQKEENDPCEKPNYGTLTLKRKHQEKERDAKMEQLRKKLRTDDEVNWVEPGKTLREQGIDLCSTLLLRRRLFFSDRNVDARDPVQLNLLYVQARDALLDQTHPVTLDKACEFAGIQCQIQFGDYKEDKHTAGFLDLKEFLPASYVKQKGIEKKVFKEHAKHAGLSELDAKVLYTKSARDLKTYGVAFFLVKEKMKGKNKLVPRLLGVTKDSVLRLDEKTKEILQTWPLTTVRRWCASPNTFTLDFGDYSDQYYSVQTTEAEQILQVIAGYIDIIVRRQRAKDHLGIEGDEGSAMLEDSVSPSKANIIQHDTFRSGKVNTESVAKPAVVRPGGEGAKSFAVGHMTGAQQTTVSGQVITGHTPPAASQVQQTKVTSVMSEPQRALLSTITTGREVIKMTETELTRASVPAVGQDAASLRWKQSTLDTSRHAVTSHIAAMNAATAQVVTLTSGTTEEVDHTAVGAAITTITTNLPEMTKGVKMLAALMDDSMSGDRLLDATRKLCSAFTDLLKAAEPETKEPRQSLLNAASRVGEASTSVLHTIGEETEEDKETQDILLSLAKAVANTTAALVLKAKNVAAQCKDDQTLQNNIIAAATQTALATSQLVACAKVVAPTIQNPACREQLIAAARQVGQAVERLVQCCQLSEPGLQQLVAAAQRVTEQLERLIDHVQLGSDKGDVVSGCVEHVMSATERVWSAPHAADMLRHARLLGQYTHQLITNIKTEAEHQDSERQRRLLAAAKLLADATARMVEAARQCASSPQDQSAQEALRKAAEELRFITVDYAQGQDIVGSQIARLQETARQATSSATQMITSAQNAAQYNTNKYLQETLLEECKVLEEQIPIVVDAVQVSSLNPSQAANKLTLITAAEDLLQASGGCVQASRGVLPAVSDPAAARHLADTTHNLADCCADLRSAVSRARVSCKGVEFDAAADIIRSLQLELSDVERAARALQLTPLPGQTAEWAQAQLAAWSRHVSAGAAALAGGARLPAEQGQRAAQLAAGLRPLAAAVRACQAHCQHLNERMFESTHSVMTTSLTLVETVQRHVSSSEKVDISSVVSMAKNISESLEQTMDSIPSNRQLDVAIENINATLNILNDGEFPETDKTYSALQQELSAGAVELSAAARGVAEDAPGASGEDFQLAFNRLLAPATQMARLTQDHETRTVMVNSMKAVTINSSKLLTTAKSVSQDVSRPNAKNQLADAARAVTESINNLVDVCTSAAPGQKECEAAIRSIEASRVLLSGASQPLNELGYFACLDAVVDQSKGLSEGMSGMASSVKGGSWDRLAQAVRQVAEHVQGLVEATAQVAYLVAVSEPSSVAGRAGLVDQALFARAASAIAGACRTLADTSSNQQQVLSAATVVAKHTSALCNACRAASGRTPRAADKRHFVQAAKDVANCTAALVNQIKALDANYTEESRARCADATGPLLEAVQALVQFAGRAEFASQPAKLSAQAVASQEDLLTCGRNIITGSCAMLSCGRELALAPHDRQHWHALADHSKAISDTIKALVTSIREKAPGQRECSAALDTINKQVRELDQVAIQAVSQQLAPMKGNTLEGYSEQIENSASEMLERLEPLKIAAKSEAENLGHCVVQLISYVEPLMAATVGACSNITECEVQSRLVEHARTVLETLALLVHAARDAAGNPRALALHAALEAEAAQARAALGELAARVRADSAGRGAVQHLCDSVTRAAARLTQHRMSLISSYDETDSYVDYQTRMVGVAKEIARLATDMTAKSATDASRLVNIGNDLCVKYEQLAADSVGASATTPNMDVASRIRMSVVELGESVSDLIRSGGHCRVSNTHENRHDVALHAKLVNEKVVVVLSSVQAGSRGTQACIDAHSTISAILGDLDTTILFASAGTLHSDKENDTFSDHRENILKRAKTLVEDTKTLVGGAAGSQEQLAAAARDAVSTIVELCEVVKQGAMSLGCHAPEPQVLLLHAARDVCAALRDLCRATSAASGRAPQHPAMTSLKHAAKRLADATKRWSLPVKTNSLQHKRLSYTGNKEYASCDSETDIFQSDQEEELVKLLDYSSQDDDVSPTIFHDNCEEVIAYVEKYIRDPIKRVTDDDLNVRYNSAARNSLLNRDWRVMKYGENILLGEVRKLVDAVVDAGDKVEAVRKREMLSKLRVSSDLDSEMKRLSQVIEVLDSDVEVNEGKEVKTVKKIKVMTEKSEVNTDDEAVDKSKDEDKEFKIIDTVFKVTKVRPVSLINSNANSLEKGVDQKEKESTEIVIKPDVKEMTVATQFWELFKDDSEWWKAIAKRNLETMEETRKDLERFSGHELVLGEIETELDRYQKEKEDLQTFIEEVDDAKVLEYDKKYEEMVLKLINFAKKDFIFKGFDPIIEQLKALSNQPFEKRRNVMTIEEFVRMYKEIDISKYSYEELCVLEKYYKQILTQYKKDSKKILQDKENLVEREVKSASPSYHRNVILNINSSHNTIKNTHEFKNTVTTKTNSISRTNTKKENTRNNLEMFDLTQTYPSEYYANNWWSIYENILKNREHQFGSIDNWWSVYEAIINKNDTSDTSNDDVTRQRILAIIESRKKRRPSSKMEEQLRMIDDVRNDRFHESSLVTGQRNESTMVTNVTSLLKTVKAVEDEHTRGTRALESTIEAISQEIEELMSPSPAKAPSSAEELVRCTRQMTAATAKAVSAGNTGQQDQLTAVANLGRKVVSQLLVSCKGAAGAAESGELQQRTLESCAGAARAYRALLAGVLAACADRQLRARLPDLSRHVARAAADICSVAQLLKGSDWVDPADPTVIAEHELLGAAASIDAAARKLDALRPRKSVAVQEADESLNFDEMILEAAKSIITATSALVRAASAAQRELIDQGKVSGRPVSSSDDGQWSEGLVSAARLVAAAAHALVEAANALVQGAASEERLVSSARQVASSTAQLLVACKVKADPSSESTRRLQAAGAEVIRSTDNLVRSARDAIQHSDERSLVLNRRMVGGIAQEIDARSEILRIEKELEEARGRLNAIRQAKYKLRAGETSDESDVQLSGYQSDQSHVGHRVKTPTSSFANTTYSPNSTQHTTHNITHNISSLNQSIHGYEPTSPKYQTTGAEYSTTGTEYSPTGPGYSATANGYGRDKESKGQSFAQSPTFSSFRPQEETPKQSYEGFTTRTSMTSEETVIVKSLQLPEVRTAYLVSDDVQDPDRIYYKREKPAPPPRRISLPNYETRMYDTPRPMPEYTKTEEERHHESSQYLKEEQRYDSSPISPKFNARELKFDEREPIYSTLNKPSTPKSPLDGVGQTFTEHQKTTEAIPGGTKHSEFTVKSESYQSYPKTEFFKSDTRQEIKSPFATSTPSKFEKSEFSQFSSQSHQHSEVKNSMSLVKAPTPSAEFERISSPYGKESLSYGGPNFMEETMTEVKEIPNGTQKVTTTKIYSSSPVNITTTDTKYEPIKLEGIDELSKFDNDSKYSTLDSRFSTLDSKLSSDTSRSFMRPSEFQQSTSLKKHDISKDLDTLDKKFSKQTITSETIERKSVMTSSHKSESSSTVTKKFGNF